jgi:N-acetylmuramic acid 6-phosphate etherase
MSLIVGVDAGGTSTEYAIERDGSIVRHIGAAANARTLGPAIAGERIARELREALADAQPTAIAVGAAGAGDPAVAQALESALQDAFGGVPVAVYDDAAIAFRAGVPSGDGVVLVAGTGSIACAWFGDAFYRAGGYGPLLGDEGSAFAIGRAAVGLTLRSLDGRIPSDPLGQTIAQALGIGSGTQLVAQLHAGGDAIGAVAALAPLVLERAGAGDRSASKIVQSAAGDLVELVKAVVRAAGGGGTEIPLVFAGGVLASNSLLTYLIETRLNADLPLLAPMKNAAAPVSGALALARRMVL